MYHDSFSYRGAEVKLNSRAVWDRLARLGLSQNDLARRAGVSSGYLSRLMNGTRCPSARTRYRLHEALGCPEFENLFIVISVDWWLALRSSLPLTPGVGLDDEGLTEWFNRAVLIASSGDC